MEPPRDKTVTGRSPSKFGKHAVGNKLGMGGGTGERLFRPEEAKGARSVTGRGGPWARFKNHISANLEPRRTISERTRWGQAFERNVKVGQKLRIQFFTNMQSLYGIWTKTGGLG